MQTSIVSNNLKHNYFGYLVNSFFKILPIRETKPETLETYMDSLLCELIGCKELSDFVEDDACLAQLIGTLNYLVNNQDCSLKVLRREVFKAINICNRLKSKYGEFEV